MRRIQKGLLAVVIAGAVSFAPIAGGEEQPLVTTVYAHGHHGGGHHGGGNYGNYGNCGGSYYCGGHEAHQHPNGVCPYANSSAGNVDNSNSNSVKKSTIKKVQKKLKKLGYRCGKANGVMNAKTKKALKRFQRDCCLKVNGVIKKQTLKALGL